ncbi:putative ATP-grasp-modified RiPP [Streptomyces sp. NPDC000594]|uniref:putative ATP-grasp-modified RiPP n=1 Tax=Streptomyces sp. NPDC000594 TaxID=3154261 RepID=UPI003328437A
MTPVLPLALSLFKSLTSPAVTDGVPGRYDPVRQLVVLPDGTPDVVRRPQARTMSITSTGGTDTDNPARVAPVGSWEDRLC